MRSSLGFTLLACGEIAVISAATQKDAAIGFTLQSPTATFGDRSTNAETNANECSGNGSYNAGQCDCDIVENVQWGGSECNIAQCVMRTGGVTNAVRMTYNTSQHSVVFLDPESFLNISGNVTVLVRVSVSEGYRTPCVMFAPVVQGSNDVINPEHYREYCNETGDPIAVGNVDMEGVLKCVDNQCVHFWFAVPRLYPDVKFTYANFNSNDGRAIDVDTVIYVYDSAYFSGNLPIIIDFLGAIGKGTSTIPRGEPFFLDLSTIMAILVTLLVAGVIAMWCCSKCHLRVPYVSRYPSRPFVPLQKQTMGLIDPEHTFPEFQYYLRSMSDSSQAAQKQIRFDSITPWKPDECVICLSAFSLADGVRRLRCGHIFHRGCIDEWFQAQTNCPLCKSDMQGVPIIAVRG